MATFTLTGDFVTEKARDLWSQRQYKEAMDFLTNSVEEMGREYQLQLLEGKMKLTGVNNLDFVKDTDFSIESYEFYPTLAEALEIKNEASDIYEKEFERQEQRAKYIIDGFFCFKETIDREGCNSSTTDEDGLFMKLVREWKTLLPDIKKEYQGQIPFYMSVWLRELDGINKSPQDGLNQKFGFFSHKNIMHHILPYEHEAWDNKEIFELYCKKYHVYLKEEINEIWDGYHRLKNKLLSDESYEKAPLLFETDYRMIHEFGWLNRDGTYYWCHYIQHDKLSKYICAKNGYDNIGDSCHELEKRGWIKIHVNDENKSKILFSHIKKASTDQIKKIKRYCEHYNIRVPSKYLED